uniref:Regulator of G-protein signaling 16 n=1 Tax=Phocoena sinus TaxID=42100 RepID=A0A8C9BBE1_PHOSS
TQSEQTGAGRCCSASSRPAVPAGARHHPPHDVLPCTRSHVPDPGRLPHQLPGESQRVQDTAGDLSSQVRTGLRYWECLASSSGTVNTAKRDGVAAFHAFLKTEFSEENLEFWLACEEFRKLRSATKLASRAHRIFEEFICSEAPKEVNIDHETRELTRTNLQTPTAMCFDVAQGKTRTLMEKDSYPRFLKSPAYRDLAAEAAAASASASPSEPSHT